MLSSSELQMDTANGNAEYQYQLGLAHIYGHGVPEDNALASTLLQQAAAQRHLEAAYHLAVCYHYGYTLRARRRCIGSSPR